jgi:hypothetical protein
MAAITLTVCRDGDVLRPADYVSKCELHRLPIGVRRDCSILEHKRTNQQNRAIRLYCKMVAQQMNEAGHEIEIRICGKRARISATPENVLENIWRVIQVAMGLPHSTTKLATTDVTRVYAEMSRLLAESFGLDIPFPSYR